MAFHELLIGSWHDLIIAFIMPIQLGNISSPIYSKQPCSTGRCSYVFICQPSRNTSTTWRSRFGHAQREASTAPNRQNLRKALEVLAASFPSLLCNVGPSRRCFFSRMHGSSPTKIKKTQHLKNTFQAQFFLNQALESTKKDICSKGHFIFQLLIFKGDLLVFGSVTCLTMDYTPEN